MESVASKDRTRRLAAELGNQGIDAFIAWSPITCGYLHKFSEGAGERFMALTTNAKGESTLICPALSATQAKRSGIQNIRPWRDGEDPVGLFKQLADEWNLKTGIIGVDDEMPAHLLLTLQAALPAALYRAGGSLLAELMRRKDPSELEAMRTAGRIADEALAPVMAQIRAGMTETDVAKLLSSQMASRGGTPTFSIVAAGANGAEPHHHNDDTKLAQGDVVVMDYGCDFGGYQSDITRVVSLGEADEEAKRVYRIVYQAHMAGRAAIRPGVTAGSVDDATRAVIESAGYGDFFMHRTGHGIGTRIHEEPYIVHGNDQILEEGNCFSVEPGIYLPGRFGVRIENIVAVTKDGHESLNAEPSAELLAC